MLQTGLALGPGGVECGMRSCTSGGTVRLGLGTGFTILLSEDMESQGIP